MDIEEMLNMKLEMYQKILITIQANDTSYLIEEIKKIEAQLEIINKEDENGLENKEVEEIITTTKYTEGKPIQSIMQYKYKDN